ncbi:uncharacterized protein EV422DRAFT_393232 [Fimicolochytrium jonesii]|uniref:uncharacterized protein n=1 Tax=Fimicolochytrium jonesii TaxID=1396493 RepID=UPI0022FF17DD|nr:uncharacterized protein EV422DRAFT_393232 [Fimicolochytrium jonesii]KAI8823133.1 hypothetical protein EV422DRAFT_393232 [Fimicolochytrium jonesii]
MSNSTTRFTLVAAALRNGGGIGVNNCLPWRIPGDMTFFQKVTTWLGRGSSQPFTHNTEHGDATSPLNVVIMGRKTWDSIPARFRPLKGRLNIVLSRQSRLRDAIRSSSIHDSPAYSFPTLESALAYLQSIPHSAIFIIGGAQLYANCITHHQCERILLTAVDPPNPIECDAFFPEIPSDLFRLASGREFANVVGQEYPDGIRAENGYGYEFQMWVRRDDERQRTARAPSELPVDLATCSSDRAHGRTSRHPFPDPSVSAITPASQTPHGASYSLSNSHPLLSLQIDPSLVWHPSDMSVPSTILPNDLLLLGGANAPPEGAYTPLFTPEKSEQSFRTARSSAGKSGIPSPSGSDHRREESTPWEGFNSTLGSTPSERAARSDSSRRDHDGDRTVTCESNSVYDSLMMRVQEVLMLEDQESADEEVVVDPETSLLQKVHEILQGGEGVTIVGMREGAVAQRRSNQQPIALDVSGHRDHSARRDNDQGDEQQDDFPHSDPLPGQTNIDFSLADGTMAMSDVAAAVHAKTTVRSRQPTRYGEWNALRELGGTRRDVGGRPVVGGLAGAPPPPVRGTVRERPVDPSIWVPRIEYESFVSNGGEDSVAEHELAPILAKYAAITAAGRRQPSLYQHSKQVLHQNHVGQRSAGPAGQFPPHEIHRPTSLSSDEEDYDSYTAPPSAINLTNMDSTTFADQLSLASMEYMKRYGLAGAGGSGAQSEKLGKEAAGTNASVQRLRSVQREQLSKVLDVERIRRLPKLGMPGPRRG